MKDYFGNLSDAKIILPNVLLGSLLVALSYNLFLVPAKLLAGGVSGTSFIINYLYGIPVGVSYFLLNLPLIFLSIKYIDRQFFTYSVISAVSISLFQVLTQPLMGVFNISDQLLTCLLGGALNGMGCGLIFKYGASTFGMDVIATMLRHKYNTNIGTVKLCINIVIFIVGAMVVGMNAFFYSLIASFVETSFLDKIMIGVGERKTVLIISTKPDEIQEAIQSHSERGITFFHGEGAWTNNEIRAIYTVVTRSEVNKIKLIALDMDPYCLITVTDAQEVVGRGFKNYIR